MMSQFDKVRLKKFLVVQTASIGDVILATPVVEKLHDHFPDASIDILVKKGNQSLFDAHPFLHKVILWDKSAHKYRNFIGLINLVRDSKYDCIINIQRFAASGLLTVFSGARLTVGFDKNPFSLFFTQRIRHTIKKGNRHETERNLDLVKGITDIKPSRVKLYPSQKDFARMSQYKTVRYITISPASLWFTKQFPKEKWIEFIKKTDPAIRIYFLGSQNDYEICKSIIEISGHKNSLNLAGNLSFLESAALMKDALMNYVNDSAPMHLASSVNAPTTAIFCSTVDSFGFGPLSDNSAIVEVKRHLDCRPCGLHGLNKCPKKHFKCALDIDTNDLIKRLE